MKIKCTNNSTRSLAYTTENGNRVSVTFEGGVAEVDPEGGRALAAAYPDTIEVVGEKKKVRTASTLPEDEED